MDPPEFPSGRSPRQQLLGPRPAPLKVSKDSHKIRKPPVPLQAAAAAASSSQLQHPSNVPPPRPPVIIYSVTPKIIHANPNEFMSLVQRLTGPNSSISPSTSQPSSAFDNGGAISPAARYASIEKTMSPDGRNTQFYDPNLGFVEGVEIGAEIQRNVQFPGILSPNPNSLPPIPRNIFSTPSESGNPFNFFNDFSPVFNGSNMNNFNFLPSPSAFFSPQINMNSPNTIDLFHSLFDL